jgi:hypothetical protein
MQEHQQDLRIDKKTRLCSNLRTKEDAIANWFSPMTLTVIVVDFVAGVGKACYPHVHRKTITAKRALPVGKRCAPISPAQRH